MQVHEYQGNGLSGKQVLKRTPKTTISITNGLIVSTNSESLSTSLANYIAIQASNLCCISSFVPKILSRSNCSELISCLGRP